MQISNKHIVPFGSGSQVCRVACSLVTWHYISGLGLQIRVACSNWAWLQLLQLIILSLHVQPPTSQDFEFLHPTLSRQLVLFQLRAQHSRCSRPAPSAPVPWRARSTEHGAVLCLGSRLPQRLKIFGVLVRFACGPYPRCRTTPHAGSFQEASTGRALHWHLFDTGIPADTSKLQRA